MEHRVDGAGAEAVPMTGELLYERRSVDFAFAGVVHDVHRHGTPREVAHQVHVLSIADIVTR
jgi:hypothetical protein